MTSELFVYSRYRSVETPTKNNNGLSNKNLKNIFCHITKFFSQYKDSAHI